MKSNEVYLSYKVYEDIVKMYQDQYKDNPIFMSVFLESLGLSYRGKTQTLGVRFFVVDRQKYFLAKIQYGI